MGAIPFTAALEHQPRVSSILPGQTHRAAQAVDIRQVFTGGNNFPPHGHQSLVCDPAIIQREHTIRIAQDMQPRDPFPTAASQCKCELSAIAPRAFAAAQVREINRSAPDAPERVADNPSFDLTLRAE